MVQKGVILKIRVKLKKDGHSPEILNSPSFKSYFTKNFQYFFYVFIYKPNYLNF